MNHTLKFIILFVFLMSLTLILSKCNPGAQLPETHEEEITTADTIVTKTDSVAAVSRKPLKLIVTNLASATAPIIIGLYRSDKNFLDIKGRLKEYKFIPAGKTLTATITDMKYGDYAMAIYQDENSSGEIDKNFIGVPTEGYAFSNNFKPKIKAPTFKDCRFSYDISNNTITMNLIQ